MKTKIKKKEQTPHQQDKKKKKENKKMYDMGGVEMILRSTRNIKNTPLSFCGGWVFFFEKNYI